LENPNYPLISIKQKTSLKSKENWKTVIILVPHSQRNFSIFQFPISQQESQTIECNFFHNFWFFSSRIGKSNPQFRFLLNFFFFLFFFLQKMNEILGKFNSYSGKYLIGFMMDYESGWDSLQWGSLIWVDKRSFLKGIWKLFNLV
jgi:hypothetical protein